MATTQQQTAQKGQFTVDTREHGFDDGPAHVLVEISPAAQDTYMAIIAAGAAGRFSFDFRVDASVELTKAYIEGHRADVEELPDWIDAVIDAVEQAVGV